MGVIIETSGLDDLGSYFREFGEQAAQAMSNAINQTCDRFVLPLAQKTIMEEVNFPAGYLNNDRLYVSQRAYPDRLEAVIKGRDRPTSLARFAAPGTPIGNAGKGKVGNKGVYVSVNPGRSKLISRAFLVSLKNGNTGMAIRLKAGEKPQDFPISREPLYRGKQSDVYLLYGPSVDQVWMDVAGDISPQISAALEKEFVRRFFSLIG